jgi:hypothetical protein
MFRRTSATPSDRLVYLYLEAGPLSHYTGLFQIHLVDIAEYAGLSAKEVLQALDRLSGWGLIVYDPSRQPATMPSVQPSSSSPPSTPDGKVKGSPLGSSSTSTPGKSKDKASGKGEHGNGKLTAFLRKKGLRIAAKKYKAGEWDIFKVSEVLQHDYGYVSMDFDSPAVLDALGLSPSVKEATN